MKESNYSFIGPDILSKGMANRNKPSKVFDWDKAALIIKQKFKEHPDLIAEAGLEQDWDYTGGSIFEKGKPTNDYYTYLSSTWAYPTLILQWNGEAQESIECYTDESSRFTSESKWDETSLKILEITL